MKPTKDRAEARPARQLSVSMLPHDIGLADAIVDLIGNYLDGALRLVDGEDVDYAKHFVKIESTKGHFLIADNCGSFPRNVAKNYGFQIGHELDDDRVARLQELEHSAEPQADPCEREAR